MQELFMLRTILQTLVIGNLRLAEGCLVKILGLMAAGANFTVWDVVYTYSIHVIV